MFIIIEFLKSTLYMDKVFGAYTWQNEPGVAMLRSSQFCSVLCTSSFVVTTAQR